jgi:hypothetical protein
VGSDQIRILPLLAIKKVNAQNTLFVNNDIIHFSYVQDAPSVLPFARDLSLYHIILTMNLIVVILNCIWTFFLLKIARNVLFTDKLYRDLGDDSDDIL